MSAASANGNDHKQMIRITSVAARRIDPHKNGKIIKIDVLFLFKRSIFTSRFLVKTLSLLLF